MKNMSAQNVMEIISEILEIDQNLIGEEYLKQFIKNIALKLDIKYVLIGHPTDKELTNIQTDVVWAKDDFAENFTYELKGTPCEFVLTGERVCIHESNVCVDFPDDLLLQEMGIEAYVGAPVVAKNEAGVSSILVLLDEKPMEDKNFFISITEFLALRASAEIDKKLIEDNLKKEVEKQTLKLKQANEEISKLNENLEQRIKKEVRKNIQQQHIISEQSKMATMGEMIESIAHQWKQPLSTISTASSGLKLQKELDVLSDEAFYDSVNMIGDSVSYLSQTINDFRNFFSKDKTKNSFRVKNTFKKAFNLTYSQFKKAEICFVNNINDIEFFGLENELLQVIINLINNAKDELEKIDSERYIFIDVYKDEKNLTIEIKDNAGGIKQEDINIIFKAYETTKKHKDGTGIGLYMSKNIIEDSMNGKITAENTTFLHNDSEYKGALFTIKVPYL